MLTLLERLKRHILQMAPHQAKREAGQLIIQAAAEIERLQWLVPPRYEPSPETVVTLKDFFAPKKESPSPLGTG